jgi:hypothetical protein
VASKRSAAGKEVWSSLVFLPHSEVVGAAPEPERILINFRMDDARKHAARLERLGVTWIPPVEPEPFGLLGTIGDLDGDYVQIAHVGAAGNGTNDNASRLAADGSPMRRCRIVMRARDDQSLCAVRLS